MTTLHQSPDTLILILLHGQIQTTVIGETCRMTLAEVRSRLVHLENMRVVPPSWVYSITCKGRQEVEP